MQLVEIEKAIVNGRKVTKVFHRNKEMYLWQYFWFTKNKQVALLIPIVKNVYVDSTGSPFLNELDSKSCGYWTNYDELSDENQTQQLTLF